MRKIINLFVTLYLLPLRLSNKLALYIKGKILTYEEHYLVTLDVIRRKFPDHKGIVVDIGAFDADSSIFFAKRLTKNKILGFEPNPVPFAKGKRNAKGYANIELFNLGFSNSTGEVDFQVTKNLVSSSLYHIKDNSEISFEKAITVKVTTLDNFLANYKEILLIKLDVQGAELNILRKGKETLKKTKLVLTEVLNAEMYTGGCMYYEVDEILRDNGFRIHTVITNYNNEGVKYFDILYINSISLC